MKLLRVGPPGVERPVVLDGARYLDVHLRPDDVMEPQIDGPGTRRQRLRSAEQER